MLKVINTQILSDLKTLLFQLTDEQYNASLQLINGSSVGQHIRHVLDFYSCLLEGTSLISYDQRKRELGISEDKNQALEKIEEIELFISKLDLNRSVLLEQKMADSYFQIQSTFERELLYVMEHSIHHFAIVKIAVQHEYPETILPKNFGIAYSTIAHEKENS